MTLIITELSEFGIAMVADTAMMIKVVIPKGHEHERVLNGIMKLQYIPYLKAGISVWGMGQFPFKNINLATDIWLKNFIELHEKVTSLDEFANILFDEIRSVAGHIQDQPLGFHLAGYVEKEGEILPICYHIRNADGDFRHLTTHEFRIDNLSPSRLSITSKPYPIIRNGDYGLYALLWDRVESVKEAIEKEVKLEIPTPSLEGRIAYHTAWIKFVSYLYTSANKSILPSMSKLPSIGSDVLSLGISPDRDAPVIYSSR